MFNKIKGSLIVLGIFASGIALSSGSFIGSETKTSYPSVESTSVINGELDEDPTYPYNDNIYEDEEVEYFGDYPCTDDCSGHSAGYKWAMEKDITDPDDCGGNSNSFIEGCLTYAQDN